MGNIISEQEKVHNPFRYSGELWDDEVELQYLRARWYDPSVGRFINEDSYEGNLKNPLSLNMYTYVENNPLIYSDPTGNWCTATVSGKYYSHPGKCSGSGSGQDYIPDENGTNFGRMVFDAGVAKGKWYPEGAFYIKGDKTGISDAAIGCAYDSQCLGFVGGAVSEIPSAYNGVKAGVSKGANWVKGLIGGDKRSTNVNIPNAENLKMSKTVQNHMNDIIKKGPNKGDLSRPYIDSNGTTLLTREIMNAGTPVRDASLKNGLRWDVVGTFRGSTGKWQLVIDLDSNTIVHFNFVAK